MTAVVSLTRMEKLRIKVFKGRDLLITIQYDLKIVHYLDVTFDVDKSEYKPLRKEKPFI